MAEVMQRMADKAALELQATERKLCEKLNALAAALLTCVRPPEGPREHGAAGGAGEDATHAASPRAGNSKPDADRLSSPAGSSRKRKAAGVCQAASKGLHAHVVLHGHHQMIFPPSREAAGLWLGSLPLRLTDQTCMPFEESFCRSGNWCRSCRLAYAESVRPQHKQQPLGEVPAKARLAGQTQSVQLTSQQDCSGRSSL